jgi:hypothetical protein
MRKLLAGSLLLGAALAVVGKADALAIAMPQKPSPARAALTDAIVVGRVMGLEDMDVKVPVTKGSPQMNTYRIAVVTVTEIVRGKKEMKTIRVGFTPIGGPPIGPNGGPVGGPIGRPGFGVIQLQAGNEGLFFLQKHPAGDFFTIGNNFDFVPDQNKAAFENDLKDAKRAARLLDDPMAGLKSKDAADRYFTAALLITQYRTPRVFPNKQETISAEESKLILQALAEHENWKQGGVMVPPVKGPGGGPIKGGPAPAPVPLPAPGQNAPGQALPPAQGAPGKAVPPVQAVPVQGGGAGGAGGAQVAPPVQAVPVQGGGVAPAQVGQAQPGQVQIQPAPGGPPIKGGPIGRPGMIDPMSPLQLFNMLGVTQQDGFQPPQQITSPDDYANAARAWCQKNAGTYRIKRFVAE